MADHELGSTFARVASKIHIHVKLIGEAMKGICVRSEINPLKKVLLHRPGKELLNLTPDRLPELLFDDIPYLKAAQSEHDAFAACLREQWVEVLYLTDLVVETIAQDGIRRELTEQFLDEVGLTDHRARDILRDYFASLDDRALVDTMIDRKSVV